MNNRRKIAAALRKLSIAVPVIVGVMLCIGAVGTMEYSTGSSFGREMLKILAGVACVGAGILRGKT